MGNKTIKTKYVTREIKLIQRKKDSCLLRCEIDNKFYGYVCLSEIANYIKERNKE